MSDCIGFVECPCDKCRRSRLAATLNHPQHTSHTEIPYCGACRAQTIQANRVKGR